MGEREREEITKIEWSQSGSRQLLVAATAMLCNACFYRRRVYSLIIYVRVTCAGLSTLPTQISEHGCTHEFQTKNNNFSFNRVFGRIYWISFSNMISLVRILAKFVELLSLLFKSRKFKTKHVVSIIRIVHVYIQHTALSPCNRSLSQQFSALVFPGLRRPIPREFPPDLIARARASPPDFSRPIFHF